MSRQKQNELEKAFERIINVGFCIIPYQDLSNIVDPDLMLFGTAKDEKKFSFPELDAMFKSQYKQMEGFVPSLDRKRLLTRISNNGNHACIAEELILTIASPEKVNTIPIRASCVMEYMDNRWKLVHWHASSPVDTENDHWHKEEWKREKEKLEKLVAERTADLQVKNRELEIEAATQRVRAVAMEMQEPGDIMKVLNVMKKEVDKFELGNIATWIWRKDEDGIITQWDISEVIEEGNLVHFNLTFDIYDSEKNPEVNRHTREWEKEKKYYTLNWRGEKLQAVVDEVASIDPESGKMFQEAVDVGQIEDYWHAASPFSRGVVGLDFTSAPPEITESILIKMSSAIDMVYQRFEDLKKAESQARESRIETALERVRSRTMAMQKSDELNEVSILLYDELKELGIIKSYMNCGFMEVDEDNRIQNGWMTRPDGTEMEKFTLPMSGDPVLQQRYDAWKNQDPLFLQAVGGSELQKHIEFVNPQLGSEVVDEMVRNEFPETAFFYCGNFDQGYLSLISGEPLSKEEEAIFKRFTKVFQQTYTRFLDLQKSEQQAYESKVEVSLERVRGMAAAMNHSDDLMQIAEAMFREMEILKINPLRYGIGMIDGEKKEAELWASTVDDGHYLDMLGTLSLTWHPMLEKVLDAWDAQHEELIYELKGKELSDYYQRIGQVNPDIPNLRELQDPRNEITQYVSFFPFKSGALYAFTDGAPGEEGRSILKRFANVFEQAHIRYNDLRKAEKQARLIREERDRLEIALKELKATQEQLVQQEKLASLGQLTAGIAHEIKNPLNFVNNFSDLSVELVEEAREEVRRMTEDGGSEGEKAKGRSEKEGGKIPLSRGDGDPSLEGSARGVSVEASDMALLLDILDDIETNLKTIHKHGSRADGIVKSMLEHSRGGSGKMEPTDLNALIKEFVNLSFHGMRASKNSINVDMELDLDESIGDIPLIAEDFSRVIINLCNNAFDAMREKQGSGDKEQGSGDKEQGSGDKEQGAGGRGAEAERRRGVSPSQSYHPKLTIRTHQTEKSITIEIEDNGPGIPGEMKDKVMQPFYTTKKGTQGTGLGLSITNDIVKAHGGTLNVQSQPEQTVFSIQLNR
ncbi:MAG: hypothetical protein GVY08_14910 [Bacteroidetes bacterium]|jgi:signal transduction histidine kinase|nr:hypothetical protein [Bacteroidota bacterium]